MQQLFFPPRIVCLSTMDERLFFSQFFSLFFSSTSFTLHFTTSDFLAAMCCTRCKIASTDILIYEFPRFLSSVLHYSDELMHFKCSHSRIECLWMKLCLINQQFFNFHTLLNLKFFFSRHRRCNVNIFVASRFVDCKFGRIQLIRIDLDSCNQLTTTLSHRSSIALLRAE